MRGKKAARNIITSLLFEILTIVSAFLIPKLILNSFGSNTNGITQSASQFIAYLSLLSAGIGSVTTASLYLPLSQKNNHEISAIINATRKFLKKISYLFILFLIVFAFVLTFFINEFSAYFTFSLVIIIGVGTLGNYYFGLSYRSLLNADQKQYVVIIIQSIVLLIHTFLTVVTINLGYNIHVVKIVSSLVYLINPIIIYFYVKKNYKIDKSIEPNFDAIDQRWDAFIHQISNFVNNNTDLLLLTVFTNLKEVSVYSIYYLVFNGIRMTIGASVLGITSAFGNMFANEEIENVKKNLNIYEFFLHSISIIIFSSMAILITPFVYLYTLNITDANYNRPVLGYLFSLVGFFIAVRIPYEAITKAAGHFKQTRNGAIIEVLLNIVMSIILLIPFGMIGLLIGTLIATIFRTLQFAIYLSKNLVDRNFNIIAKRYIISFVNVLIILLLIYIIPIRNVTTLKDWIVNGIIVTGIGIIITILFSVIFYKGEMKNLIKIAMRIVKKNKN